MPSFLYEFCIWKKNTHDELNDVNGGQYKTFEEAVEIAELLKKHNVYVKICNHENKVLSEWFREVCETNTMKSFLDKSKDELVKERIKLMNFLEDNIGKNITDEEREKTINELKNINTIIEQKNYNVDVEQTVNHPKKRKIRKSKKKLSGFAVPTLISHEMCDFLQKPRGTMMARTEITKDLNTYIKKHNLQNPQNMREIFPDGPLKKLLKLKPTDQLSYFNLQRYISPHVGRQNI